MRILVTGALGQLGREICRLAESSEHTYVFTDSRVQSGVSKLDITDPEAVKAAVQGIDVIVNCAAYTDVNRAAQNLS